MDPENWELPKRVQPRADAYGYDLERALRAVVGLQAAVPDDAFTAETLGTERMGSAVMIREDGVLLTIGYLVTEATEVSLKTAAGRTAPGHVLGYDAATGFGLVQALEPLDIPTLPLGSARRLAVGAPLIVAAGGGRGRALEAGLQAKQAFAGYWEYLIDEALFTAPAHPLWSGAAVLNEAGELVGIGSLRLEQQEGDGRVVPFNMSVSTDLLTPIFDALVSGKPAGPPRPWLGVLTRQIGETVVIVGVTDRGPARRAELREGDAVLAVGGRPVSDLAGFYRRLWDSGAPGEDVELTLRRGSDVFKVEVRTADRRALMRRPKYH